jgi:hypothetical protein
MNIRESLEQEHSKALTLRIIAYIGSDTSRLAELMACFFDKEGRICQRAAWPVGLLGEKQPALIEPYLEQILLSLKQPHHDAISRNTMRLLNSLPDIPDAVIGLAADAAFKFLEDPSVPIAIRAFSIRILGKICRKEPDLKDELKALLEDVLEHEKAPGLIVSARDVLKQIASK